jgi:hypothetical protein
MPRKPPDQDENRSAQRSVPSENVAMPPAAPTRKRTAVDRTASLQTIEVLLDYAILESAQLELPFVVCLLRMARLELDRTPAPEQESTVADGVH